MNGSEFTRINGSYSTALIGTYQQLSQDTVNNCTNFRLYLYFYYGGGTSVGGTSSSTYFQIDGTTMYSGSYRFYPGYTLLGTKDITVYHNGDGSFPGRAVGISANSYHINGSSTGYLSAGSIARYATVTGADDFNDEGNPKVYFNNPGNFWLYMKIEAGGNDYLITRPDTQIHNPSSPYTWDFTEAERDKLRALCTTSNKLSVRFTVGTSINASIANWSYVDRTMSIVNANPIFSNFDFEDVNPITLALTGDNKSIIKSYSTIKATIFNSDKATALKKATMSKYRVSSGSSSTDISYNANEDVSGNIMSPQSASILCYAIDSRGNSTGVTKQANNFIEYTPLTKGSINVSRENGVSEEVTLTFTGTFDNKNFGQVTNSIKLAQYRYKATDTAEWSEYQDLELNIDGSSFSFDGLIKGDSESLGFNIENSYQIEVLIKDELSEATFTGTFSSGVPNIALSKNGVGIMGKYDESEGGLLQVGGVNIENYLKGIVLYDNSSGNNGTLTLSDNLSNYQYIELFYRNNDGYLGSAKVYKPNGKYTTLMSFTGMTNSAVYVKFRVIKMNENTISTDSTRYREFLLADSGIGSWQQTNYIYLTKVIGYK